MSDAKLQVSPNAIPDSLIIEPKVFGGNRSTFAEPLDASQPVSQLRYRARACGQ